MHFSYASAFLALSSVSVTYAAPFEAAKRQDYSVVNVDGESTTAPTVETVTQTISSIVTEPGSVSTIGPQTITVTATPSSVPYSSGASSSTPVWHFPPPPGESFFPPQNGFIRRGLSAAGNPLHFARAYSPSVSSSAAAVTTATPSSSVSLIARRWGWSSVSTPAYSATSTVTPTASASLYARGVSSSAPASSTRYAVRRAYGTPASSITGSATPASSWSVTPTFAPLH
ncbi:hypothetical protein N7470_002109 [Penicillium chermesinum]|nr:hypothetical protein N7470_002109 [Penicillium chermesinum]